MTVITLTSKSSADDPSVSPRLRPILGSATIRILQDPVVVETFQLATPYNVGTESRDEIIDRYRVRNRGTTKKGDGARKIGMTILSDQIYDDPGICNADMRSFSAGVALRFRGPGTPRTAGTVEVLLGFQCDEVVFISRIPGQLPTKVNVATHTGRKALFSLGVELFPTDKDLLALRTTAD